MAQINFIQEYLTLEKPNFKLSFFSMLFYIIQLLTPNLVFFLWRTFVKFELDRKQDMKFNCLSCRSGNFVGIFFRNRIGDDAEIMKC